MATRLTLTHVDETHSLNILRYCGRGNSPSWFIDLNAVGNISYVKASGLDAQYYTASALPAKAVVDSTILDLETLHIAGVHLHTVQKIAHPCSTIPQNSESYPLNEWWKLAKSVDYDELAFWMALLAKPRHAHHDNGEVQRHRKKVQAWLKRKNTKFPREFWLDVRSNTGHKMFVTESGAIGFCQDYAQERDQVCVLFGGDTPYILRPTGASGARFQYTLIEPCYVHGVIEGELVERIKAGEYEEKVFALV